MRPTLCPPTPTTVEGRKRFSSTGSSIQIDARKTSNMPAKTSKKKKRGGAKSEKRKAEKDSRKQLQSALKHANAQADPLSLLPELLELSLSPVPSPGVEDEAPDSTTDDRADGAPCISIEHRSSPLPENLLRQCLRHFEVNMGELYRRSNWGLDMEGKRLELEHKNARFLLALKKGGGTAGGGAAGATTATNPARPGTRGRGGPTATTPAPRSSASPTTGSRLTTRTGPPAPWGTCTSSRSPRRTRSTAWAGS